MKVTYEREVGHCQKSPYVKQVTIKSVEPAQNSDNLDTIQFEELGWQAISQKGLRQVGQKVWFIPAETVMPFELSEELDVTKYLSKGRVKSVRLRGNRSEGLIVEPEKVEPYLDHLLKWEDLPSETMGGDAIKAGDIPLWFHEFYKMPNILNEPNSFQLGELVWYSEKIHGCLHKDTRITLANGEERKISDIPEGSMVLTCNEKTMKMEPKEVNKIIIRDADGCGYRWMELELDSGRKLICTEDHKIMTRNRGWVDAGELTEDDDIEEL
jgi:hypothetical protein